MARKGRMKSKLYTHQSTCRFATNNGSIIIKQRIVLVKTSARFEKNNVSFWWKQRVVLWEVTCCFQTTFGCRKNYRWATHQKQSFSNCKKSTITPLARTRTRTSQEFLHFCCHKCHSAHHNTLYSKPLRKPYTHFNEQTTKPTQTRSIIRRKNSISNLHYPLFQGLIFPICDTCDSKKSTSLLEGARVHAYEKENTNTPKFTI